MQEVPCTRHHHCHARGVSCRDDFGVTLRTAGLDNGPYSSLGSDLHTIGLWEEGIRREHGAHCPLARSLHRELDRSNPRGLPRAHTDQPHVTWSSPKLSLREYDGIRLDMANRAPGKI